MNAARRLFVFLAAMLAIAACGSSAPSTSTVAPSTAGQASHAAAPSPSAATATARPSPAVAAKCDKAPKAFDANHIDLTGPWAGDDDGIYYLRQIGSVLWWNGMSGRAGSPADLGRDWNNVGRGVIKALKVDVEWADGPRGGILGNGTLSLKIEDDGTGNVRVVKVDETGTGFGNSIWTYCTPG
jgi:subtilisin family serine protease